MFNSVGEKAQAILELEILSPGSVVGGKISNPQQIGAEHNNASRNPEDPEEASTVNILAVPGAIVEGLTNPGLGVMVDNKSPKLPLRSQHPSPPTVSSSSSDF